MGLSVDDFLGLDTDEFDAALKAFSAHEEQQERERWERMRLLGLMAVQPWSKTKLTAEKLLPLPWDTRGAVPHKEERPRMGKAEHRRRAKEMLRLLGDKY